MQQEYIQKKCLLGKVAFSMEVCDFGTLEIVDNWKALKHVLHGEVFTISLQ